MHYILVTTLAFKHGAFQHESEWRLLTLVSRDNITHVRLDEKKRSYVLMPYNALAKDLLREIWLAPAHPNEVDTAKTFFSQKCGKPIEVIKSQFLFEKSDAVSGPSHFSVFESVSKPYIPLYGKL